MTGKRDEMRERLNESSYRRLVGSARDFVAAQREVEQVLDFVASEVARREAELTEPGKTTDYEDVRDVVKKLESDLVGPPIPDDYKFVILESVRFVRKREEALRAALRLANERAERAMNAERAHIIAWLREAPARMEAQRKEGALSLGASHEAGQLFACDQIANWLESLR